MRNSGAMNVCLLDSYVALIFASSGSGTVTALSASMVKCSAMRVSPRQLLIDSIMLSGTATPLISAEVSCSRSSSRRRSCRKPRSLTPSRSRTFSKARRRTCRRGP